MAVRSRSAYLSGRLALPAVVLGSGVLSLLRAWTSNLKTTFGDWIKPLISTDKLHFKILAPALSHVPHRFRRPQVDARMHNNLIFGIQLVRGLALRECGQMGTQLLADGRHFQQVDFESWHVLLLNGDDHLLGCARYRPLQGGVEEFGACQSALAQSHRYGPMLRSAMERLIANVKTRDKQYGEAGGWALRPEVRGSTAAVNIALMTFALAEHLDSGLAVTTATTNHHSSSILCRIGARRVEELPAYYEPKYGSMIELLQFSAPNPRYAAKLGKLRTETLGIPVICATEGAHADNRWTTEAYAQLCAQASSHAALLNTPGTIH